MQGAISLGTSPNLSARPTYSNSRSSDGEALGRSLVFLASTAQHSIAPVKLTLSKGNYLKTRKYSRVLIVRANISDDGSTSPIAPLQPESPTGQFLVQLLQSHPHLVPAAAEQQLEKLAEDRDAENSQEQPNSAGTELVLYRRIAELKAQERRKALEEIIYTLIVQKFVEAGISMVPDMQSLTNKEKMDSWPIQGKELESVHSPEASEMIQDHLALVLGGRGMTDYLDQNTFAQISKLRVGQVYAASIIYGYFLRRVDHRFQLEKSMKLLPPGLDEAIETEQADTQQGGDTNSGQQESLAAEVAAAVAAMRGAGGMRQNLNSAELKPSKLRAYVMSFDSETLHRCATIRSKESVHVLEKHTEALFGRPEIQIAPDGSMTIAKDEVVKLSFSGLRRLVLEAVAFGSFLWDVETYVDSSYNFVAN